MNSLIIIPGFVLAVLFLFAALPAKRAYTAARCFKIVASAFSISKICEAIIEYFRNNGTKS
jgi:UPF0716 family protein affecting phage T7 exclusion